ncbi:ArsR/SmtB family transcription factor [Brevibacillus fluminis]|uniref:ArsR/SmtB family transcription factor n=1 Tax=Brevibacillus fluminis TaxID=511487 RepID=UPI003F8ACE71
MYSSPNLVEIAALIGDPSRIAILINLIDGKALPASELARCARITPQTASSHLAKLVEGQLLVCESYGRHKYYRLASPDVAHALEALSVIANPAPVRSLRESDQLKQLQYCRTCYDHLAGTVGVALTERLLALEYMEESGRDFVLRPEGKRHLHDFGVNVEEKPKSRRHFARQCLDWSERRHHLAGSLGASLTDRLFALKWIERQSAGRAARLTAAGREGFAAEFGLVLPS